MTDRNVTLPIGVLTNTELLRIHKRLVHLAIIHGHSNLLINAVNMLRHEIGRRDIDPD